MVHDLGASDELSVFVPIQSERALSICVTFVRGTQYSHQHRSCSLLIWRTKNIRREASIAPYGSSVKFRIGPRSEAGLLCTYLTIYREQTPVLRSCVNIA